MPDTSKTSKPSFYKKANKRYPEVFSAVENLGTIIRTAGPLDEKTSQLIQLAAAAARQGPGRARQLNHNGVTVEPRAFKLWSLAR